MTTFRRTPPLPSPESAGHRLIESGGRGPVSAGSVPPATPSTNVAYLLLIAVVGAKWWRQLVKAVGGGRGDGADVMLLLVR
jgi:hypothetical protein